MLAAAVGALCSSCGSAPTRGDHQAQTGAGSDLSSGVDSLPRTPTSDGSTLWSFAPADPVVAEVIDGSTLESFVEQYDVVLAMLRAVDGPKETLSELVAEETGIPDARSPEDVGIDPRLGFAAFVGRDSWLAVIPIAERDLFVRRRHGVHDAAADLDRFPDMACAVRRGRYVCADRTETFNTIGTGADAIAKAWPSEVHGGAEAWLGTEVVAHYIGGWHLRAAGPAMVAVQIGRGTITVRAHVAAHWLDGLEGLAGSHPRFDRRGAAAFGVLNGRFLAETIARNAPDVDLVTGVSLRRAVEALDGRIEARAGAGSDDYGAVEIGLRSPEVIRQVLGRCDQLPAFMVPSTSADACRLDPITNGARIHLEAWLEGERLHLASSRKAAARPAPRVASTAIGDELADGSWTLAAWGRFSMLASSDDVAAAVQRANGGNITVALSRISELGVGLRIERDGFSLLAHVRAIDADPAGVVRALEPLVTKMARGESVRTDAAAVAARFPHSQFAADFAAGWNSMWPPYSVIGGLAMVAASERNGP